MKKNLATALICFVVCISFFGIVICTWSAPVPSTTPSRETKPELNAWITIQLDGEKAAANSILATQVTAAMEKIEKEHADFTLEDVQDLLITNSQGKAIKLSNVAKVHVKFKTIK